MSTTENERRFAEALHTTPAVLRSFGASVHGEQLKMPLWSARLARLVDCDEDLPRGHLTLDKHGKIQIDVLGVPGLLRSRRAWQPTIVVHGALNAIAAATLGFRSFGITAPSQGALVERYVQDGDGAVIFVADGDEELALARRVARRMLVVALRRSCRRQTLSNGPVRLLTGGRSPYEAVWLLKLPGGLHRWLVENVRQNDLVDQSEDLQQQLQKDRAHASALLSDAECVFHTERELDLESWLLCCTTRGEQEELLRWVARQDVERRKALAKPKKRPWSPEELRSVTVPEVPVRKEETPLERQIAYARLKGSRR